MEGIVGTLWLWLKRAALLFVGYLCVMWWAKHPAQAAGVVNSGMGKLGTIVDGFGEFFARILS